ncbi:A disintegrin and metalloproteinase with thrombospondin motifs 6-like [Orbicella faveolata]|uniref:A disintegrin and metalloproteinase with thrombospondin motifs 6-like n=1 Tax=Orbicella faveolata TaxID=48498 RepID=UPI0009E27DFF|nr:A disintegrin and metalloproteinase with thrombospondin motifs 6-like [Orbicella faveolata]
MASSCPTRSTSCKPVKPDSYWLGGEASDPGSTVALSIDNGMVAGIFRDNSIGKIKVNYVVSRLIIITNKELKVAVSSSSKVKLDKLRHCTDVHKPKDKNDTNYFDVTSLIQIGPSGGLAVLGGMCLYRTVANVNRYQGLQTAKTLAHETGHNFGLNHDGDNGCRGGINIMASVLIGGEGALKWSSCSRDALQKFLRFIVIAKTLN